jgi:hypothetical protein
MSFFLVSERKGRTCRVVVKVAFEVVAEAPGLKSLLSKRVLSPASALPTPVGVLFLLLGTPKGQRGLDDGCQLVGESEVGDAILGAVPRTSEAHLIAVYIHSAALRAVATACADGFCDLPHLVSRALNVGVGDASRTTCHHFLSQQVEFMMTSLPT